MNLFFFFKENTVKTLKRGREKTDQVGICPGHPPASHLPLRSPWPQGSESVPLYSTVCSVAQSCPTVCDAMDCSPPGSSIHGDSLGKNTGVGGHALLEGLPNPGTEPQVSRTAGGFFTV